MSKLTKISNAPENVHKKINRLHKNGRYKENRASLVSRPRPEITKWKENVFSIYGHICCLCGNKDKLVVDHIEPYAHNPEKRFLTENGRVLCTPCHRKTSTYALTKKSLYLSSKVQKIKELKELGFKNRHIAEQLGITEQQVHKIVKGKVRYSHV